MLLRAKIERPLPAAPLEESCLAPSNNWIGLRCRAASQIVLSKSWSLEVTEAPGRDEWLFCNASAMFAVEEDTTGGMPSSTSCWNKFQRAFICQIKNSSRRAI